MIYVCYCKTGIYFSTNKRRIEKYRKTNIGEIKIEESKVWFRKKKRCVI